MIIDFKEIPAGNEGGDGQDQFELFSRDFLEGLGFKILQHPSRGADGGKDMIVRGRFDPKKAELTWLVSCKHFAHSKSRTSVKATDEINILERVSGFNCQGFIGIYSTIAQSGLSDMLSRLGPQLESEIFDHRRIEGLLVNNLNLRDVFWRYFTESYDKHKEFLSERTHLALTIKTNSNVTKSNKNKESSSQQKATSITEADLLQVSKTAVIIVEILKIRGRFFDSDWEERKIIIRELYAFSDHTSIPVAEVVIDFLSGIADQVGRETPENLVVSLFSLTIDYFPYSDDPLDNEKIENLGEQCANLASSLVYDASIKYRDYQVIMYGLTILKFIYKKAKQYSLSKLVQKVDDTYLELESQLQRPERNDLTDPLQLVNVFKQDREEGTLSFPPLPENLHRIIYPS